jgi:Dolichyl-phosphate-mannose-protein mannosyltransferase
MRPSFRFIQWCQSCPGGIALLLVLITGALLGYYGWLALAAPPPPTYYLDFGATPWIQASEPSSNVCFRKNLYLSETPKYAWLQMVGIDGFRLTVNGKQATLGQAAQPDLESDVLSLTSGGNESVICDITHYLLPGRNTIAVNVTRGSFPGRAKLVCRGGVINQAGKLSEFSSDRSWRVALTPGTIPALISWTDREMDDARWPHAEIAASERTGLTQPVTLPPVLLQQPVKGKWIIDERPGPAHNTTFHRHFDAPNGNTDAWLQVAANGNFSVIFNGHFLGDFTDSSPMIHFLHLKRWMKAWENDLSIQVHGLDALPALIADVSFLSGGADVGSIVSSHDWMLPSSRFATTIGSYNYAGEHWGLPPKMVSPAGLPSVEATHQTIVGIALMLILAAAVCLGWIWSGSRLAKRHNWEMARALGIDATLHLPALVATATLLLLRYDIRLRPEAPVRVEFFLGLLALLILPRLPAWARRKEPAPSLFSAWERWHGWGSRNGFWLALGVIVLAALAMRLHGLTAFPLDQDDILIRNYAMGIFDRGYPSLNFYKVIPISTYELLPYPIALSCFIFGWSDWAVLLPAVVFGTLTTLLLGLMGRNLFDWRAGLLAALIYAFDPLNVFWAQHCFHPSQDQFFTILTIWLFYLAIRQAGKLDPKYFYAACLCFCLAYFSWEGQGFLLPVLAVTLLLMHPSRWSWLREPHLWVGMIVVGSIVLIQLSVRSSWFPAYRSLGYGLPPLTPSLFFLNPESAPFYYVSLVLVTEPHLLLTILLPASALFAWRNLTVRYCLLVFLGLLLCFSLFLPIYSIRYFYFYQTLLILLPCGVFFLLWDRIRELTVDWRPARLLAWASGIAGLLLVLGTATETGLKVFRLSEQTSTGRSRMDPSLRYGAIRQDTRNPAEFVASRLRPGDIVLANLTQAFYLYGKRIPDYALNPLLAARITYVVDYASYRHKFVGIPMVLNLRDIQSVFDHARRIWYVGGAPIIQGQNELKNVIDFVTQRSKIVYATYHAKVYLWDGTGTLAQQTVANPALPPQPGIPAEKPAPEDRVVEELSWAENGKTLSYPRVTKSDLYPEWTHQNVLERDPARVNAKLRVQPLQPPREPEKPESDENVVE